MLGGGLGSCPVVSAIEESVKRLVVMFLIRSWSFLDIYSKTERGADGRGVSPSAAPRWGADEIGERCTSLNEKQT